MTIVSIKRIKHITDSQIKELNTLQDDMWDDEKKA